MKKTTFLLIAFLFFCMNVTIEANPRDCMVVHFADGSKLILPIANEPRIYFEGKVVNIFTDRYQASNIRKYTFEDFDDAAISSTDSDIKYLLQKENGKLTLKLSDNNPKVKAYTLSGIEIPITVNADKTATIYFDNYFENVLLLQIGNETIKIQR